MHSRASLRREPRSLGSTIAVFEYINWKDKDLNNIRDYICNNPMQGSSDEENLMNDIKKCEL
jgi:hypothetical protein